MNYKEHYSQETIDLIEELVSYSYALDDMLTFIKENTEDVFRNYYETYVELAEEYSSYESIDNFIRKYGIMNLDYCELYYEVVSFYNQEQNRELEDAEQMADTLIQNKGIEILDWWWMYIRDTYKIS
jgi:hypothetical protein